MFLTYVFALTALGVAGDQYRMASQRIGTQPLGGPAALMFELAGLIGGLGWLIMMVAGFFVGRWWWPLAGLGIGVVLNIIARSSISPGSRSVAAMIFAPLGLAIAVAVFVAD
jgi:hypothetical protein